MARLVPRTKHLEAVRDSKVRKDRAKNKRQSVLTSQGLSLSPRIEDIPNSVVNTISQASHKDESRKNI